MDALVGTSNTGGVGAEREGSITDVEQAAFAENALMYRATLSFLDGQIRSIKYAIKGGE